MGVLTRASFSQDSSANGKRAAHEPCSAAKPYDKFSPGFPTVIGSLLHSGRVQRPRAIVRTSRGTFLERELFKGAGRRPRYETFDERGARRRYVDRTAGHRACGVGTELSRPRL